MKSLPVLLLCAFSAALRAQSPAPVDTMPRFFGVPLVFYSPDTRWGFGAAGIVTFRGQPLRSSVTFSLAYTQRKQWLLWFPYQIFGRRGRWRAYGELGFYRYFYQYFGVGNRYPFGYIETYTARYPRFRANALRRLTDRHSAGFRYWLDDYRIVEKQVKGEIAEGKILGSDGGLSSAVGPVWLYDSRDNPFYPRKGWLVEGTLYGEHRLTGSDFAYLRASLDGAGYFPAGPRNMLVVQVLAQFTAGGSPFFSLPQIGGTRLLRGYPAGKFRDRHLLLAQAEWRFALLWRLKGAAFAGAGSVFGSPGEALRWRPNGGAGIRFEVDRKQHIHLRADYGFGDGASGFYLTVGEAF